MLRFMLIVCLILFVATVQAFAQQPKEDVVHLKNGSVVHGTITELIPGEIATEDTDARQEPIRLQDGGDCQNLHRAERGSQLPKLPKERSLG